MHHRYEVRSPVDGFVGRVAGVTFTGGAAECSDPASLAYFRRKGYEVRRIEPAPVAAAPPPRPYDTKRAWVDYAASQGFDRDAAELMTKARLVEVLSASR